MYYFEHGNETYRVRFRYEHLDEPQVHTRIVGKESKYKHLTECIVEKKVVGTTKVEWIPVVSGEAWCSVQDQFRKETGRKHSLVRATAGMSKSMRGEVFSAVYKST
jgi:hypothetical protein